jgi:hypothetical protein
LSKATFYSWKKKYGGLEVSEARRLRSLEDENDRLKRLVADQAVQLQILKEVNAKSGRPVAQTAGDPIDRGKEPRHHGAGVLNLEFGAFELLPRAPAPPGESGDGQRNQNLKPEASALWLPAHHGAAPPSKPRSEQ